MTTPSPEALALAREQLEAEHDVHRPHGIANRFWSYAIRERVTVIELRRQLAEKEHGWDRLLRDWEKRFDEIGAELATERQRAEAAEEQVAYLDKSLTNALVKMTKAQQGLAASEAKRKALREAYLPAYRSGTGVCTTSGCGRASVEVGFRDVEGARSFVSLLRLLREQFDPDAALAADTNAGRSDGKDTPPADPGRTMENVRR